MRKHTKTNQPLTPYRWLMQQAQPVKSWIWLATLLGLLSTLLVIVQAFLLAKVVALVFINQQPLNQVMHLLIIWLGVIITRSALNFAKEKVAFVSGSRVRQSIRKDLFIKLASVGPVYLGKTAGELSTYVVENIEALHGFFADYQPQMMLSVLIPSIILVVVFSINWICGLILLLTGPLIPLFMAIIGMGAASVNRKNLQALTRMSGHFLDVLQGLSTLRLFNRAQAQSDKIAQVSNQYRQRTMATLRIAFLSSGVLELFASASIALLAVYLGLGLLGHYHVGTEGHDFHLFQALFILLLAPEFFLPLRELGSRYHDRAQAIAAAEELLTINDLPQVQEATSSEPITSIEKITFQHIAVHYESRQQAALQNISFSLQRGELVALVGASGSGKTSLINALMRLINIHHGEILVDGKKWNDLSISAWREQVSWVGQKPQLFSGTIRDNLLLANPDAAENEIQQALYQAGASQFVNNLAQGLDTDIAEQAGQFSGGQAQRLALARGFLKPSSLLLLDEPSASLDEKTDASLMQSIVDLAKDRIVLMATHRLACLKHVDRIIVLEQGRLVETGTYDELLARNHVLANFVRGANHD